MIKTPTTSTTSHYFLVFYVYIGLTFKIDVLLLTFFVRVFNCKPSCFCKMNHNWQSQSICNYFEESLFKLSTYPPLFSKKEEKKRAHSPQLSSLNIRNNFRGEGTKIVVKTTVSTCDRIFIFGVGGGGGGWRELHLTLRRYEWSFIYKLSWFKEKIEGKKNESRAENVKILGKTNIDVLTTAPTKIQWWPNDLLLYGISFPYSSISSNSRKIPR